MHPPEGSDVYTDRFRAMASVVKAERLAHQLDSALAVVVGCTSEMRMQLRTGESMELRLRELERAVERAMRLTRELVATGEAASAPLGPVYLDGVIAAMPNRLRKALPDDVSLALNLRAPRALVLGEEAALDGLVLNLVLNAGDATPSGGTVSVETALVGCDTPTRRKGDPVQHVRLTVADSGVGMTADLQARLFESFFTMRETGTGVGLLSVALTVERLNGRIHVANVPGAGTRIHVDLPTIPGEETVTNRQMKAAVAGDGETGGLRPE
jgi:signal transduction histidine kinase